jgi:CRP/FNR family transcriptional regulator
MGVALSMGIPSKPSQEFPSWLNAFPLLADIGDEDWKWAIAQCQALKLPADTVLFQQGAPCKSYLMVADGTLRLQYISNQGREVVLYRILSGGASVSSMSCLLTGHAFPAMCVAETAVRVVFMPSAVFLRALEKVSAFRNVAFNDFSNIFYRLMSYIEQMAFGCIESRLALLMLNAAQISPCLLATHDQLARELGTDRVVITRAIHELERKGLVQAGRGRIQLNHDSLQTYFKNNPL